MCIRDSPKGVSGPRKAQTGQTGNEEPHLPDRPRASIDQGAGAPDSSGTRQSRRDRPACLSAYPAPFIRHAFAGERRGPPHHPGDAGTFGHRHHADLHASGTATAEFHPSPFSSQRMMPLLGTTFQQGKSS